MFARFVYYLLGFRVHELPDKYKKKSWTSIFDHRSYIYRSCKKQMPHKMSQCKTKQDYGPSDTVPLFYFKSLDFLSTNEVYHFVIICSHILMFYLFGLSSRKCLLSSYIKYRVLLESVYLLIPKWFQPTIDLIQIFSLGFFYSFQIICLNSICDL